MCCKMILSLFSYVLPCIGFIAFFVKQNISIREWEARRDAAGRIGLTACELDDLGGLMQREVKKAHCDTFFEGLLVSLGAIFGICALFV